MREITVQELEQQAREYADEVIEYLKKTNAASPSGRPPLKPPEEGREELERLYRKFVAKHCLVKP
jgi:hypothetical protein